MKGYLKQTAPFVVPTDDGKLIEEHYGRVASGDEAFSVAHMIAPPGWGEPAQTPEFAEVTVVIRGRKQIEVEGEIVILEAGQSILLRPGTRVRYSNPFPEACEYWSFCVPGFDFEQAHRE